MRGNEARETLCRETTALDMSSAVLPPNLIAHTATTRLAVGSIYNVDALDNRVIHFSGGIQRDFITLLRMACN